MLTFKKKRNFLSTDKLKKDIDGDGGNKLGAGDEVAMDAREEPTLGDSGKPRDEKGLVGLRVRDPGSSTAGKD